MARRRLQFLCFPAGHSNSEGDVVLAGSTVLGSLYTGLKVCANVVRVGRRFNVVTCRFMLPPNVPPGEVLGDTSKSMEFLTVLMEEAVFPDGQEA